jgi:hypothetical protein
MMSAMYANSAGRPYTYPNPNPQLAENKWTLATRAPALDKCKAACHPVISAIKEVVKDWAGHVHDKAKHWWDKLTNKPTAATTAAAAAGGGGASGAPAYIDMHSTL